MELEQKFDAKAIEEKVREHWQKINLNKLLRDELKDRKKIGFIEGPPTMNGEPHVGHLRGRVIKDLWYRFSTLRKFNVVFRAGWDTQGLPVELQAEKELGLSGNKADNLKVVGMEKIVEQCKKLVHRYHQSWVEADRLLGVSFDQEKAYWTYRDEYIEREWKYLQKAWQQGILTEGYRVVAYCPSCQTSLSHAEVSQGYEVVEDPSLYYKVRSDDAYLIVWTTMPFTVVTDEMVGVSPDADYVYVKVPVDGKEETWIVAKNRLELLMPELKVSNYSVIRTVKGEQLGGKRYKHPLLDQIGGLKEIADKIHLVVAEKFVDIDTGSGIVHLSPANGEEDFRIAQARNIPIFNPIDDQVRFTEEAGIFSGLFVRDADQKVVEALRQQGALVRIGRIKHEYPTCWRSHHKLVWLARREYFILIEKIADRAMGAAEKVEYFYGEPKNRFTGIIREQVPWCISRERVWGAPLPIWACSKCGHKTALFGRQDIVGRAVKLPDGENFELHRPWIDRVVVKCEACGADSYREQFVLDTWHNSGAAPYSSLTDEEFADLIPVPFLSEGIDQTRGWAYTLLIENVIFHASDAPPFKAFLFQGHVLDEKGNKMSKSLGNVIDGMTLLKNTASDLVRFYFMWKAGPVDALNFSVEEMKTRSYQVLSTLYHLHVYFVQNSGYDRYDVKTNTLEWASSNELLKESERWLLSKLQHLTETVTNACERCRFHEAARTIEEFVINHLSQTYVPLTRSEIWDDSEEGRSRRLTIYATLAHVLKTIDVLLHPVCPFMTEYLYSACFKRRESVMLESWPSRDEKFVNKELERSFAALKDVVSVANAARMKASLKRRWPLSDACICMNRTDIDALKTLDELLRSQLNVSTVRIIGLDRPDIGYVILAMMENNLPVMPKLTLKRGKIAPKVKADIGRVQNEFAGARHDQVLRELEKTGIFTLVYDGKEIAITKDDVEIGYEVGNDYAVAERENVFVLVSTVRDKELMAKGLARDIARRLQSLRKERGYNPTQILDAAYVSTPDDEVLELMGKMLGETAYLVRVKKVEVMKDARNGIKWSEGEIDGRPILLSVE